MKYLKSYKLLEREFSSDWFENNPKNYLSKNKEKLNKQKEKLKTIKETEFIEELKNIKWTDIKIKSIDLSSVYRLSKKTSEDCLYKNKILMSFQIEYDNFNRIHNTRFLEPEYQGIGVGYKCYKAVIDKAGWVRSSEEGTNENSRKIWSYLIQDKDYFSFEVKYTDDFFSDKKMISGFIIFKKLMNKKKIEKILQKFISDGGKVIKKDPNF